MSSYRTSQPAGAGSCLRWVSHYCFFPLPAHCWVCKTSLGQGSAYARKKDTKSGNARKQASRGAVLLLGSHHGLPPPDTQVAFIKGREGERLSIPHCSRGRKSPDKFSSSLKVRDCNELERSNRVVISCLECGMRYSCELHQLKIQHPTHIS